MKGDFAEIYAELINRIQAIQESIRRDHAEGAIESGKLRLYGVASSDELPPHSEEEEPSNERMLLAAGLAAIPPGSGTDSMCDTSTKEFSPESVALYWSNRVLKPIQNLLQTVRSTFDPEGDDLEDFYTFARTQLRGTPGSECSDERQAARILVLVLAAAMPAED